MKHGIAGLFISGFYRLFSPGKENTMENGGTP
jgi:hypothetical protein